MSYSTEVLADSPLGYWRLGETGSTAEDSSAQNNDLTFPASGISKNVSSLLNSDQLNGAATFINTTANGSISRTGWAAASLETWVRINSSGTTSSRPFFSILDASSTFSLNFGIRNNPRVFYVQRAATIRTADGLSVPLASSFHLILTFERIGTNDYWNIYINGSLAWSFINNTAAAITDWASIRVGAGGSSTTVTLDEVAVYGDVLPESRILAHYEAGIDTGVAIPSEGLVHWSSRTNATTPTEGLIRWPRLDS
jgi:hypothetical protein